LNPEKNEKLLQTLALQKRGDAMPLRKREDEGMGFLLQYENVAWFEESEGNLRILDRRIFPEKCEFVTCFSYTEAVQAIKLMVSQSGGQFSVAAMGMALASYEAKHLEKNAYIKTMQKARDAFINARPTTKEAMTQVVTPQYELFEYLINSGADTQDIVKKLQLNAIELNNIRYSLNARAAEHFAKIVKNGTSILTHCFGETCFAGFLRSFNDDGKKIRVYSQETRPFFQGARLTASLASDLGFDVTVITDAMSASLMQRGMINYFVSATDAITQDGHVINKVGTLNTAIVATHFDVPYYAIGMVSKTHKSANDIEIEMRNGEDVLSIFGRRLALENVHGLYPSFDITPPNLIKGIATEKGLFKPNELSINF